MEVACWLAKTHPLKNGWSFRWMEMKKGTAVASGMKTCYVMKTPKLASDMKTCYAMKIRKPASDMKT